MSDQKEERQLTPEEIAISSDRTSIYRCQRLYAQAKEFRRKFDWDWLVRNLYVRGYHHARYNRGTNTVTFSTRSGVRIPVNLVSAHLRGVRNQVTSFQPKWEVLPNMTIESAFQNARFSGKVLDYTYERSQIKRKIKEIVNDALIYSIGIWQFDVDRDGQVVVNRVDPFDFFVDPNVKSPNINDPEYGAEYVILAHQMSLDAIKKNKEYEHTDEINPDNLIAAADYKQFLLQVTKNQFYSQREVNQTVILKQAFMRERQEDGEIKMRIITYVDSYDRPLKNELIDTDEYPFEILQGDIQPGELYGEAWIKHLIPINRVIDALESHIFEYNHFFAKGRFIVDKNSGVRLVTNQHGQIIEKNRGSQVQPITVPPLPSSPMEQIQSMKSYLEDLSGVHDVSLGRFPGTMRSGTAIAELKQSDATNQADLVDNLEDFLSRSGRKILKLVAQNWTTSRLISVAGTGGKPEYFMAIGENGSIKNKTKTSFKMGDRELPLAIIGEENEVRVQVGSWLAYTKEARLEKLKEMFRLGAIDQKTFLEHAEFADIDGIIDRTRAERIFQQNAGSKSETIEKDFGIQLSEEELALAENEVMEQGIEQFAQPEDDHKVHIMTHREVEKDNKLTQEHIREHERLLRWQRVMQSKPVNQQQSPQPPPGMEGGQPPGGPEGEGGNTFDNGIAAPFQPFMMGPQIGPGARPLKPFPGAEQPQ